MPPEGAAAPQATFELADEVYEAYANNVYYEASAWDLKLLFGQLDQTGGTAKILQHSAITLPWPLVKIMIFWLRGQVEMHEALNGKIRVPPAVIPIEVPPLTEEVKKLEPNAELAYGIFRRLRDEFVASLKD